MIGFKSLSKSASALLLEMGSSAAFLLIDLPIKANEWRLNPYCQFEQ